MNTSIIGDKIIVLWQVLLAGGVIAFSATFGAWLMGRKWRKKGEQPPRFASRSWACAAVAIASLLGLAAAFGLLITVSNEGEIAIITLPSAAIVVGCIITSVWLMGGWTRSVKAHILIIVFLCGIAGAVSFFATADRLKDLSKRCIDGSSLNGIGKGLMLYHDEYGAYPDDLRRLVDYGQPAKLLLSMYSTRKDEIPETYPAAYPGPCDYIYIRLPEDVPDDLVWVWQPVRYNEDEGGWVLLKDAGVRWMKAERLKAEVARTHKWLEAHPTTQPATAPSEQE